MIRTYTGKNIHEAPDDDEVFINQRRVLKKMALLGASCDDCCCTEEPEGVRCFATPDCRDGVFVIVDTRTLPADQQDFLNLLTLKGQLQHDQPNPNPDPG